jgi:hypothetical protein
MKKLNYLVLLTAVILISACNNGKSKPANDPNRESDTTELKPDTLNNTTMGNVSMNEIADGYLKVKNSLGEDNALDAAKAGAELKKSLSAFSSAMPVNNGIDSMKELISDATEHADHISENQKNIVHQRMHFDFLSRDMYDLLKKEHSEKELYKVKCPMYNEGKGAFWISENGDNHNPYFGKRMPADSVDGEKI